MRWLAVVLLVVVGAPVAAHDWYSDILVPGRVSKCCGERDCRPAVHRVGPDGKVFLMVDGLWWPVDPAVTTPEVSPAGRCVVSVQVLHGDCLDAMRIFEAA